MDSILTTIKKLLGLEEEDTHFDMDIIMHINGALLTINQLGVGGDSCMLILDSSAKWVELFGERSDMEAVKILIYLKVRLMFDPPTTSYVLEAIKSQILEIEWRLMHQVEKGAVVG
jgi:hypothetical protein